MRPRNMKMHRNPAHPEKLQPKIPKDHRKGEVTKMDENRKRKRLRAVLSFVLMAVLLMVLFLQPSISEA